MRDERPDALVNLKLNIPPSEAQKRTWTGYYKGIDFEIQNWDWEIEAASIMRNYWAKNWTHYIIINIDKQIPEELRERFWLKGKLSSMREDGPKHLNYSYSGEDSIINHLEFHGGCTYYSKVSGFEGEDRRIKIGCDYQHLWDQDKNYDIDFVYGEVKETIESLVRLCQGKIKAWSRQDGHYYLIPQEIT